MRRIAHLHSSLGHTAYVYNDSDWEEYCVKFYDTDGQHFVHADYHTDDKQDAMKTARLQLQAYKLQD